jgi:trehalose-phosphatase
MGLGGLAALSAARGTEVAIVSGRSVNQLRDFLGSLEGCPLVLCGLHGGEIYDLHKQEYVLKLDPSLKDSVGAFRVEISTELLARSLEGQGLKLEDKGYSLALHYRNAPSIADSAIRAMRDVFDFGGYARNFHLVEGKMVLEMVPKQCSKGSALEFLHARAVREGKRPALFMAGDDRTDESAFIAAKRLDADAVTVRVGDLSTPTAADLRFPSPDAIHSLITTYTGHRMLLG